MDEEEFNSIGNWRPFGTAEVSLRNAQSGRCAALAAKLFGRTNADLERQLAARHPEIPTGYDLADFRGLLSQTGQFVAAITDPKRPRFLPAAYSAQTIRVGVETFGVWEARHEIVRRAVEFLENLPGY